MIHNIKYRMFVYENEDEQELRTALDNIFPDVVPEVEEAEGLLEDEIIILSGVIDKKRYLKDFLNNLFEELDTDEIIKLYDDIERKMDDQCNLFLRLSKEDAINEDWHIIDNGDSIHLKIKIEAYPAKKEIAVKNMKEFIKDKLQ
ncbi:exosome protein [Methanobrevibacter sp. 87.7]|uniref:RNA-binding protein n=1 Tax=Methanobrevibacter sp. 87.7 TaxID=387957 RepID=UPI000B505781|nr:RNA-binding protein [Methanobrevibacter sp. 87.7]OWT32729.1 exosome protein [Methanobrevibacter sp. 87.7]